MDSGDRQAILIAGMHRSGTSAVAGAINLLGAAAPARMIPATAENPSGFWESPVVAGVNDTILKAGQSSWYDCLDFDCGKFEKRDTATAAVFVTAGMIAEFANGHLLLVKDPRLCLLLDIWLAALREMRMMSVSALLVLRHPCEVIASLSRRDALPPEITTALWLHYMLTAEYASRRSPRYILRYDLLLRDWRSALSRAGQVADIRWPVAFDAVAPRMNEMLRHELRHHHAYASAQQSVGLPLGRWADQVYQSMLIVSGDHTDAAQLSQLDRVRAEFRQWRQDHGRAWSANLLAGHPILAQPSFEIPVTWEEAAASLQLKQAESSTNT